MTNSDDPELVRLRRAAFASRLRQYRARAHLSQQDVAERAGMDRSFYGSIEAGKRSPRLDRVWDIAAALEVHITELLED